MIKLQLLRYPFLFSFKKEIIGISMRGFAAQQSSSSPAIPSLGGKKGKLGKVGPSLEKKVLEVETDAEKLVNYVCGSNILKEGGEDIKLKDDSEYPSWLWELNTGDPPPLEEIEPDTFYYWYRYRKLAFREKNKLLKYNRRF